MIDEPTAWLDCDGPPVVAVPSRAGTLLLCDSGACYLLAVRPPQTLERAEELEGVSSAVATADGGLAAGLFANMVACWNRDGESPAFRPHPSPVLSLLATPSGLVAGDASGCVTQFASSGGASRGCRIGEAIVALARAGGHIVALGRAGTVGRVSPSGGDAEPVVFSAPFGRPLGVFDLGLPRQVGAFNSCRLARIDATTGEVQAAASIIEGGIAQAIAMREGKPGPVAVRTDDGGLWLADPDLQACSRIVLPGEPARVVGLARDGVGGLLAWTEDARLFAVAADRRIRRLASNNVALAYGDPLTAGRVAVIRWDPGLGMKREFLQIETSK